MIAEGKWTIIPATGGYAGLQGRHSKRLAVGDFTTTPATATIMRDGKLGPDGDTE